MICRVPLWCAEKTSTFGPTHIHSRHRREPFSAMVYIRLADPAPGVPKRMQFTEEPVKCVDDLQEVLHFAGLEARFATDGSLPLSTYEVWKGAAGKGSHDIGGPALSENIVQLIVSGPKQPDLSIVDLPGLKSGISAATATSLADTYLGKPESLILLCLAAGGSDPSTNAPEVQLVLKHDPELKRSMIIVTKPDHIDTPTESDWGDLILGRNQSFSLVPAYGVHPVRCRKPSEYRNRADSFDHGKELFRQPEWLDFAEVAGRSFSWRETQERINMAYKKLVKSNVPKLRRRIQESTLEVNEQQALLPPPVEHPVDYLHGIIEAIAKALEEHLTDRGQPTQRFVDIQMEFERDLRVTSFTPLLRKDAADEAPHGSGIYLDEVHALFAKYRNARASINMHAARAALLKDVVARWAGRCHEYNKAYWAELENLVGVITDEVCEGKDDLSQIATQALHTLTAPLQNEVTAYISARIESEKARPDHVEIRHCPDDARGTVQAYMQTFAAAYPAAEGGEVNEPVAHNYFPATLAKHPEQWHPTYVSALLNFMAFVQWQLQRSIARLQDTVGRELPVYLLAKFLPRVPATLRDALGLNAVSDGTRKRAHDLCEPDEEITARREAIKKRRETLEELQSVVFTCGA
ncbi:hypothetical protein CC85DRAFT_57399 [Cutaneotrichosporon oleaginosum]|uniref:Dynamin N-terminal domain-containing protein n=1 Tax=Cutaneotrichosporon oleaginosum TaxID=879819 RepID=A0A0J0XYT3_9TREE|nr:uncharacterized protein CC85DRAFT_57399 [Cutaneotrichosporon oleaginosum]KLT46215.1 hypothetical protein CC85DRAFT_57399 [Cutaneotrichosporon oleaginosum]TXT10222.1 hypothetical protein COLE_04156 [Cutaneotrichosporon oleaginosum]